MPNLTTTFKIIKSHDPCSNGWRKLLKNIKPGSMDDIVSISEILESNGVRDAFWSLRCWSYIQQCLLLANVAESVLHIFEEKNPSDKRPRQTIEAIRDFKNGEITYIELLEYADNAADAADDTYNLAAASAAYAATYATFFVVNAITAATAATAAITAATAATAAVYSISDDAHWQINNKLMIEWIAS